MTLVATASPQQSPILIGDLLVSGPEVAGRSLRLPGVGSISEIFPAGSGFVPVSLRQKLLVLNGTLAIGWAGNVVTAATVLRELASRHAHTAFDRRTFEAFVDENTSQLQSAGVQLVGWLLEAGHKLTRFRAGATMFETERYGLVEAIGSGSESLRRMLQKECGEVASDRETNEVENATALALVTAGQLASLEIADRNGLLNYFGGGYETATMRGGRFEKIGDVLQVFWLVRDPRPETFTVQLLQFAKWGYSNDILFVRCGKAVGLKDGELEIEPSNYAIESILRSIDPSEVAPSQLPSFDAGWICHYFIPSTAEGWKRGIAVSASWTQPGDEPSIRITETEGGLVFGTNLKAMKSLFDLMNRTL